MQLEEIKARIEVLQNELGKLIDSETDSNEIYRVSLELDRLIVLYYKDYLKLQ